MSKFKHMLVAAILALPVPVMADDRFTEADFNFDLTTSFHKQTIIAGVNHLAATNARCTDIDPASVRLDYDHGNPDNPSFAVICGKGDASTTVFFTKVEVEQAVRDAARQ